MAGARLEGTRWPGVSKRGARYAVIYRDQDGKRREVVNAYDAVANVLSNVNAVLKEAAQLQVHPYPETLKGRRAELLRLERAFHDTRPRCSARHPSPNACDGRRWGRHGASLGSTRWR
jgi:hypothetical protein